MKRSIYFAILQGYVIFETELYMYMTKKIQTSSGLKRRLAVDREFPNLHERRARWFRFNMNKHSTDKAIALILAVLHQTETVL